MSFPTWLPWAARQSWGRTGPRRNTAYPVRVVLHSTETGSWPSYSSGADQPHLTIRYTGNGFEVRQHQTLDAGARALLDSAAQPVNSTNTIQVEMIGSCDAGFAKKYGYPYLPGLGDDYLAALGAFLVKLCAEVNCPTRVYQPWRPYPASYGYNASQRMAWYPWSTFSGICGHQHVPGNDHGDPGNIDVTRALELAGSKPVIIGHPDNVLADGDSGPKVEALQRLLNDHGATLDVDGVFGPATEAAVKARQAQIGVEADGAWGPLSVAAEARAEAGAAPKPSTPAAPIVVPAANPVKPKPKAPKFPLPKGHAYAVDDHTNLTHSGIRGNDAATVKRIQRLVGTTADGIYGPNTKAAVVKWQRAHHLTPDGEVGPATFAAMFTPTTTV